MDTSIHSLSKSEKYKAVHIYPAMNGSDSWYVYLIKEDNSYFEVGPYLTKEEAERDLANFEIKKS